MDCEAGFTKYFDIVQETPAVSHPVEVTDLKLVFLLMQKVHNRDFISAQY